MISFEKVREFAQAITDLGQPLKRGTAGEQKNPLRFSGMGGALSGGAGDTLIAIMSAVKLKAIKWIKRLGFWGFLFFLVKGLLWLLVPALIALWAAN